MRTAEEHIEDACKKQINFVTPQEIKYGLFSYEVMELAINLARKETIEECAKIAWSNIIGNFYPEPDDCKEAILELINELK